MQLRSPIVCALLLGLAMATVAISQNLTAEQILANHLKSFGPDKAIEASKLRMAVGPGEFTIVSTSKTAKGNSVLASDANNMALFSTFGLRDYKMERIGVFDSKITIPAVEFGHRSPLGEFLNTYDRLIASRLFGGSIFSTWPLYTPGSDAGGKFEVDGKKKVDGKDAWVLKFTPKGGLTSGSSIKLYFDAKDFHHIRTVFRQKETDRGFYDMATQRGGASAPPSGYSDDPASNGTTLTEDFSDYSSDAAGISLPHKYALDLAIDSVRGTAQFRWKFEIAEYKLIKSFPAGFFSFTANAGG